MILTPCSLCGKPRSDHLANTHNCPLPSRSKWKQFHREDVYTPRKPTKRDIEKYEQQLKEFVL